MEILDLYDENGKRINKTIIRGEPIKDNEYCMAVDIWIKNDKHQILITQRHPSKTYPQEWECTSGFILSGENSISGALREVEEEIGIKLNQGDGKNIHRIYRYNNGIYKHNWNMIVDIFLFYKNIDIEETILQKEEVIDIKWVYKEEFIKMYKNKEIVDQFDYALELMDKGIL